MARRGGKISPRRHRGQRGLESWGAKEEEDRRERGSVRGGSSEGQCGNQEGEDLVMHMSGRVEMGVETVSGGVQKWV